MFVYIFMLLQNKYHYHYHYHYQIHFQTVNHICFSFLHIFTSTFSFYTSTKKVLDTALLVFVQRFEQFNIIVLYKLNIIIIILLLLSKNAVAQSPTTYQVDGRNKCNQPLVNKLK